jgi:hypothetical protein
VEFRIPDEVTAYLRSGKPLTYELDVEPWRCEFWMEEELPNYNVRYEVHVHAPGYFGFATSGGGEMYAVSPAGAVVCLPFVGMSPAQEVLIAESWLAFLCILARAPKGNQ